MVDAIVERCGLSHTVADKLTDCGVDMTLLLDMQENDFIFYNVGIDRNEMETLLAYIAEHKNTLRSREPINSGIAIETDFELYDDVPFPSFNKEESQVILDIEQNFMRNSRTVDLDAFGSTVHSASLNPSRNQIVQNSTVQLGGNGSIPEPQPLAFTQNPHVRQRGQISLQENGPPRKKICQRLTDVLITKVTRQGVHSNSVEEINFPRAFKLTPENICREAIERILKDSLEGEAILGEYKINGILSSSSRDTLTHLIINRCNAPMNTSTTKFFHNVSVAITELMPNECAHIYYIAPHADGNESKNAKGKLPDRWRNVLFILRKNKVIGTKQHKPLNEESTPSIILEDEIKCHMTWLVKGRQPWNEVKDRWEATHAYRVANSLTEKPLAEILEQEWPILKSVLGPRLIQLDFKQQYPQSDLALEKKWESFFNSLYSLRKSCIRNNPGKALCKKYESVVESENLNKDGLRILLLPHLVPPTAQVKTKNGMKKPSISKSAEASAIWTKTVSDVLPALSRRRERYKNWKEPSQPCIVLVAEDTAHIQSSYVSLDNQLWKIESPLRALDTLLKLNMMFNLSYPKDCEQIWVLLQQYIYGIYTASDKSFPIVKNITTSLNHMNK